MEKYKDWNVGSGNFEWICPDIGGRFEIKTDSPFTVWLSPEGKQARIVAPDDSTSRSAVFEVREGDLVEVVFDKKSARYSWIYESLKVTNYEAGGGEKIVEHIPVNELSMYDKLRAELLAELSERAGASDMDTLDEEDSELEFDDDDGFDAPYTPYEAADEYLDMPVPQENEEGRDEAVTSVADDATPMPADPDTSSKPAESPTS